MPGTTLNSLNTFGELLKHLRRRARLTQKELGIAVGYSEAHMARLESGQRLPDLTTVRTLMLPALDLNKEPDLAARLIALAEATRGESAPQADADTLAPRVAFDASRPNNLPAQLTSFVGREREKAEVMALLDEARLLTITGSGGAGKTRLAIEVGHIAGRGSPVHIQTAFGSSISRPSPPSRPWQTRSPRRSTLRPRTARRWRR